MPDPTKRCPKGHIIPVGQVFCPLCQQASGVMEDAKTRVDFESPALASESIPTQFEGKPVLGQKSLGGWIAVFEGRLQGETFSLYPGKNVLGSSPHCSFPIPDEGVEAEHLSIRVSGEKWFITDLDSETGILLNGKRTHRSELKDGDKIKVGKAVFRVKML